jgi:hypothetical protein
MPDVSTDGIAETPGGARGSSGGLGNPKVVRVLRFLLTLSLLIRSQTIESVPSYVSWLSGVAAYSPADALPIDDNDELISLKIEPLLTAANMLSKLGSDAAADALASLAALVTSPIIDPGIVNAILISHVI